MNLFILVVAGYALLLSACLFILVIDGSNWVIELEASVVHV